MTVHLISVGLSVLNSLADPENKLAPPDGKRAPRYDLIQAIRGAEPTELLDKAGIGERDRRGASEWLAAALVPAQSAPRAELVRAVTATRPGEWPLDMSAELETFGRVQRSIGFSLSAGDIAVLICSDTPDGLLAGAWNAAALTGGNLDKVRYVPDPAAPLGDLRGQAVLVRVTGMDAGNSAGFSDAMRGLCRLARGVFASRCLQRTGSGSEEFRFYLSGGFKAAIPYLVGLAEAVRSVDAVCLTQIGAADLAPPSGLYPVKAYVLHETASWRASVVSDVQPIELPLRRLAAEAVREELTGFKDRRCTADQLPTIVLEGYAYEVVEGKPGWETYELTAFGEGLRDLFGVGEPAREGFDL